MDLEGLNRVIQQMEENIRENKVYLSDLDQAIGDGDHGVNMARGFKEVLAKLEESPAKNPADLLKKVGMTLAMKVGGASGPLYGTGFMRAGAALGDQEEVSISDLAKILKAGIEGVQARGKAVQGEKTMLDCLIPAQEALEKALEEGKDEGPALDILVEAAKQGAQDTKMIKATKGRAAYLGERSRGHLDPGAVSSALLIQAIRDHK